ncbi:hypothetical protein L6250_02985, partial [Candidatus Parcubacteria bacterium]|nr:hypothetical protein [Candidatus Parcubacteria bacterium]
MKYQKPYYSENERFRPTPPTPMVQVGVGLFLRAFKKEIKDDTSWERQPSLSQLIMHRGTWLFWNTK